MNKRIVCWLAMGMLAAALLASGVAAQTEIVPDAGVRGSGVVMFTATQSMAQFDVNVTRVGTNLFGGLKWVEAVPSSTTANTTRPNVVVTKEVKSLRFLAANHIVVEAVGYWNDRLSNIRFEALDDLAGDFVHVTATTIVPTGSRMPTMIYDKSGGVAKGNVAVFGKPLSGNFSKGSGTISVSSTLPLIGQFNFSAQSAPSGTSGVLQYAVINPLAMSPIIRPAIMIQVRKFNVLKVDGNTAIMVGPGTLNGVAARITLAVSDNYKPGTQTATGFAPAADMFKIEAVPTAISSSVKPYAASGPLTKGDLVVGEIQISATK